MRKLKNIFFMAIFSLIMTVQTISASAQELSDLQSGIYNLTNEVYHESEIGMSMARSYLDENITLEKEDGKWYYILKFTGTNYMENYRIYINEEEVSTEIIEENEEENSIKLKFETSSLEADISTNIYVDAMGRDVEFDIIPQTDTLTLVEAIEEEVVQAESTEEDDTADDTTSEVESSSSNKTIFIAIGAVVVLGAVIFGVKKIKK